jgi:hypothetical protein
MAACASMRFSLFVAALDGRWLILKFKGYPHLNWYVSPWRDGCFLHIMALCFPKHEWHAETDVAMRDGSQLAWRCATRWKRLVDSLLCRKGGAVGPHELWWKPQLAADHPKSPAYLEVLKIDNLWVVYLAKWTNEMEKINLELLNHGGRFVSLSGE